jgi:ankyrin repeat protein
MLRRVDYANIPGVTCSGTFADITPQGLKSWLGKDTILPVCDPRGNTYLHRAVTEGAKPFVIKFLLKRGVDIDARNQQGETALIIAAWYGREELAELLLKKGADANVKTRKGLTALKVAKANGYEGIVKKLLAYGAKSGRRPAAT